MPRPGLPSEHRLTCTTYGQMLTLVKSNPTCWTSSATMLLGWLLTGFSWHDAWCPHAISIPRSHVHHKVQSWQFMHILLYVDCVLYRKWIGAIYSAFDTSHEYTGRNCNACVYVYVCTCMCPYLRSYCY